MDRIEDQTHFEIGESSTRGTEREQMQLMSYPLNNKQERSRGAGTTGNRMDDNASIDQQHSSKKSTNKVLLLKSMLMKAIFLKLITLMHWRIWTMRALKMIHRSLKVKQKEEKS